jgi:hypothetical protein
MGELEVLKASAVPHSFLSFLNPEDLKTYEETAHYKALGAFQQFDDPAISTIFSKLCKFSFQTIDTEYPDVSVIGTRLYIFNDLLERIIQKTDRRGDVSLQIEILKSMILSAPLAEGISAPIIQPISHTMTRGDEQVGEFNEDWMVSVILRIHPAKARAMLYPELRLELDVVGINRPHTGKTNVYLGGRISAVPAPGA